MDDLEIPLFQEPPICYRDIQRKRIVSAEHVLVFQL